LVDDGVLGLTRFETPDLLKHFLAPRRLNSDGYDVYNQLMQIEPRGTELLHPAGGDLSSPESFALSTKAQRFKILSLFEGMLSADETGVIRTELDVPEFSGRGRLFAVAASGARFGTAERTVQIARDIVTEADLPRFAAPGDVFTAPLTVFNSSEESRDITIVLSAEGELSLEGTRTLSDSIPAGGSCQWTAAFKALAPGTAVYTVKTAWKENGEEKSYEQRIEMPVRSPFPVVTLSGSGFFQSGDVKIDLQPIQNFEGPVKGSLVLADTPFVDLTRAVNFLANYPYGCLEQTLSAAWPFLVLPDAIAEIDPLLVRSDTVRRKTDYALRRLQSMQLYDGSFAKWPGGNTPYNWGSVYAAHFLVEARKSGVDYPEEMLTKAVAWLKSFMASLPSVTLSDSNETRKFLEKDDMTTKAYAAYDLTLYGEKPLGWLHYLKENEESLWASGRIWLAGAYSLIDGRADALRKLGSWSDSKITALYGTLESNVRNTAQLLSLWAEVEPRSPETLRLALRLLDWGKLNLWYSTQENAAVAMALGRYLLKVGHEKSGLTGVLTREGLPVAPFQSGERTAVEMQSLLDGPSLSMRTTGTGSGYYSWTATGTPSSAPDPDSAGLSAQIAWLDRKGNPIPRNKPLAQGTEVVASLTLQPSLPIADVAISYLLPAGMELENPRLEENGQEIAGVINDIRDDRLLLFADRLSKPVTYRFVMRAVTRGTFAVPPLAAEGMYNPDVRFVGKMEGKLTIE
jgi:uncharacterized protein YfaS (alpha-2-macroglobulin family)